LANKRSGSGGDKKLRLSMNDDEIYVCVSKVFGGGLFQVIDNNGDDYKAHLRGKMKGPNKRHNFVSLFSILLVGKRSDLSDSLNCDILFVYDDHDVLSLSVLPNLNISNILSFHQNHDLNHSKTQNNTDLFISQCDVEVNVSEIINTNHDYDKIIDFNDI